MTTLALDDALAVLLGAHRRPDQPALPAMVTRKTLAALVRGATAPGLAAPADAEVRQAIDRLVALNEAVGTGERVAAGPPLVVLDPDNLAPPIYRGDRSYLPQVRAAVGDPTTDPTSGRLRPDRGLAHRLQSRLIELGVRVCDPYGFVERLPAPRAPLAYELHTAEDRDPLSGTIANRVLGPQVYAPTPGAHQADRWTPAMPGVKTGLLKTAEGRFLWGVDGLWFELGRDAATLAMYHLDAVAGAPLAFPWDEDTGTLHLTCGLVPHDYYDWLRAIGEAAGRHIRFSDPTVRPLVKAAIARLGGKLV